MANTFYRKISANVGTTATQIGSYSVSSSATTIIVGFSMSNTTGSTINATAYVYSPATGNTMLVKSAPISAGAALVVVGGDQKLVLQANDTVFVQSTASSSIDAYMSIMEIT